MDGVPVTFGEAVCRNGCPEDEMASTMSNSWGPKQLSCTNCNKTIQAERFNYDNERPFCEECYSNIFLKRCFHCDFPIKERIIVALDKFWHEEHFTCHDCDAQLTSLSYFKKHRTAYCEGCYTHKFAPKCRGCELPITDCAVIALEEKWHAACFNCSRCEEAIKETTFEVCQGKPLCPACSLNKKTLNDKYHATS